MMSDYDEVRLLTNVTVYLCACYVSRHAYIGEFYEQPATHDELPGRQHRRCNIGNIVVDTIYIGARESSKKENENQNTEKMINVILCRCRTHSAS